MSYVRIVSKRAAGVRARPGELVIDVDRSHPSLGNRHAMQPGLVSREQAIARNAEDLSRDEALAGPMSRELDRIAALLRQGTPVALRCWCTPKPCHAENYRKALERRLGHSLLPPDLAQRNSHPSAAQGELF